MITWVTRLGSWSAAAVEAIAPSGTRAYKITGIEIHWGAPTLKKFTLRKLQPVFTRTLMIAIALCTATAAQTARWTETKANAWYAQQPWLIGSNYVPKSAINQLEMWQEATFDPAEIDIEFTWAESMGMNTMRVFLHDLLWQQDAAGFQRRIDQFLTIASRHHIRPMLVLFDSCWDP